MFSKRQAQVYCCEPMQSIDGFEEASSSVEKYDIHHKFEYMGLSSNDLIELDMYYHRPACELMFVLRSKHSSFHSKDRWNDTIFAETASKRSKSAWESPEFRQKQKEGLHRVQNTVEYRNNLSVGVVKALSSVEARMKRSAQVQKQWDSNSERRKKQKEITTALWENPEYRKKVMTQTTKARSTSEYRQKITEINREKAKNPKFLEKLKIARDVLSMEYRKYKQSGGELGWNQWRVYYKTKKCC